MRSRVTILIAAAIIASVLAAGCTSSMQNQSTSQAASSTTHDPVLQAAINDDLQAFNNATWVRSLNQSIQWVNATTATVTYRVSGTNRSLTYTAQYTKYASASDASNYVSSINQGYSATTAVQLINNPVLTTASSGNTHQSYLGVTNGLPSTVSYIKMQSDQPTSPASYIIQVGDVVTTFNATLQEAS